MEHNDLLVLPFCYLAGFLGFVPVVLALRNVLCFYYAVMEENKQTRIAICETIQSLDCSKVCNLCNPPVFRDEGWVWDINAYYHIIILEHVHHTRGIDW